MRYRTIVADPPWSYKEGWPAASTSPLSAFNRGVVPDDTRIRAALPYGSMTIDEIIRLPVCEMACADAHLLLWTTNRYIVEAYGVVSAWGFRPSQLLTWGKSRRGLGPGGVFANTSEFILYARRGKPKHIQRQDSTWWDWPRAAHSVKPDAMLDMIEQTFPGPYLEMFARRARFGWDYWGDQSLGTADMEACTA